MAVTFKDRGCVTHVVARTMRWQLNAEAACMSHAIIGLANGKNGLVGPRQGPTCTTTLFKPRRRCWGSTRSRRTPTLVLPVSSKEDGRPGPIPLRCPILASTQSGLQTRGWCASGRGSLIVAGIAAPDRSPVYGEDGTEKEKASEGLGHLPRLANRNPKTGQLAV